MSENAVHIKDGTTQFLTSSEVADERSTGARKGGVQRPIGNHAMSRLLQRAPSPIQREPALAPTTYKYTMTVPDHKLAKKQLSYVNAELSLGATLEYEWSPPPVNSGGPSNAPASPTPGPSLTDSLAKGPATVKGTGGINDTDKGAAYQAEVGAEWEKIETGIAAGFTPKAKLGGEGSAASSKLGLEFSMEGQNLEPKFGFTIIGREGTEIKFLTLEMAVDVKAIERSLTLADGSTIKMAIKITPKIAIEPNYFEIARTLAEEYAASLAAEAAIAGGMIFVGAFAITGFVLTYNDGKDYARAIDHAEAARKQIVNGFVAGALGSDLELKDDFTMEGYLQGKNWRSNMASGITQKGLPLPLGILNDKASEIEPQIRASALKTANSILHQALVERYWEIHYIQNAIGYDYIDTTFKMLMEGQGFGRPQDGEGKGASGPSLLNN